MEDKEYLEETKDRDEGGKAVSEEAGKTPVKDDDEYDVTLADGSTGQYPKGFRPKKL